MDILVKNATTCMPLFRDELFSDVICKKTYGNISQVWHFPGHVVLTTNDGRKLFTFDCIPVSLQQSFDQRFLDFPNMPTPLLDCIMLADDILALVDRNGSVKLYKFSEKCVWVPWGELDLCQSNSAEVISVGYVWSTHQFVWCEKRQSPASSSASSSSSMPPQPQYCVCKRQLPANFSSSKVTTLWPSSILLHNCPGCDIYAITQDSLLLSLKYDKDKVTLHMIFNFTDESVTLYVGDKFVITEIKDGVHFQEMVIGCLPNLLKVRPGLGDCGVRADVTEGHAAVLTSSGDVEIFTCQTSSGKKQLSRRILQLSKCEIDPASADQTLWFLHKHLLGIVSGITVRVYSLKDGSKLCMTDLDKTVKVEKVVPSRSPVFLAWILSDDQLYGMQGKDRTVKEIFSTPDKLPEDNLLQTDILRLARLQQRKSEGYSLAMSMELEKLKQKWADLGGMHQQSEVAQILAPYMEEYWRLDDLSKALLDSDKGLLKANPVDSPKTIVSSVMETRSIGRSSRHSKLLWLSQVYPRQLLDYLCQGVSFNDDTVDQNQLRQWQSLIGLDGGDLLNFEFVCRLLFHLEPAKLLPFVKCAEAVSEQAVGVSAFIRKKHTLIYYKAACECLPECQTSADPKTAAFSKAKLIQASECDNCTERALKCYLQHGLWAEAIALLKRLEGMERAERKGPGGPFGIRGIRRKEGQLPILLHVTVKALAQNQVLSDYVSDLFSLMPNWKSFVSFSKVVAGRPELRQQQLSTAVSDVFTTDSQSGVPLEAVKSSLLDLVKGVNAK